jgi:hypothetical protein
MFSNSANIRHPEALAMNRIDNAQIQAIKPQRTAKMKCFGVLLDLCKSWIEGGIGKFPDLRLRPANQRAAGLETWRTKLKSKHEAAAKEGRLYTYNGLWYFLCNRRLVAYPSGAKVLAV